MSNRRKIPVAVQDQADAAAADARRRVTAEHSGRVLREVGVENLPPAHQRLHILLGESLDRPAKVCPHKHPDRLQVTHWFAAEPDYRMCDACAEPIVRSFRETANQCDLCYRKFPHDVLTLTILVNQHFITHAALCDECHPEGADAPRVSY